MHPIFSWKAKREVNMQVILKHELMPVPLSLAERNRTMRTGNKSILADVLTENVKWPQFVTLQGNSALLIDCFALVAATGKPEKEETFGDYADCYLDAVLWKGSGYQRIDVLFDRYRRHSIKATTRGRRSKNTARPVRRIIEGRHVPLPMRWQAFLSLGNKGDLARFLSDEIVAQAPAETTIIVSGGCSNEEDVLFTDPTFDVAFLTCNHEEADTRFILHAISLNGHVDNVCLETQTCSYFSWRIVQSCHRQCGYGQGLQRSQSTYHWKRSGQISLVTPQVHFYHFVPSPAVTAPRSSVHI